MSTYQFYVTDGETTAFDPEGVEMLDGNAVRIEALQTARLLLAEGAKAGLNRSHWRVDVTDLAGALVVSLPFSKATRPDVLRQTLQ